MPISYSDERFIRQGRGFTQFGSPTVVGVPVVSHVYSPVVPTISAGQTALTFDGTGSTRQVIYWDSPPWMYGGTFGAQVNNATGADGGSGMTYIWRCRPASSKTGNGSNFYNYWTLFFWGNSSANDGVGDTVFSWDSGVPNSYYGAHPFPYDGNTASTGQNWELSIGQFDLWPGYPDNPNNNNGRTIASMPGGGFNQWYDQCLRAWRQDANTMHHEFYWDLRDTSRVITYLIDNSVNPNWGDHNPPIPRIMLGQSMWQSYLGDEEWKGQIGSFQIYDGLLSVANCISEAAGSRTATGNSKVWFRNEAPDNPFTDKSGQAHHPTKRGSWPAVASV